MKDLRTGAVINADDYTFITAEAEMPQFQAKVITSQAGNASWRLKITYKRSGRNDEDLYPAAGPKDLPKDQAWNILNDMSSDIRGGEAVLTCKVGADECELKFHIRGTNPSDAVVEQRIGNTPWYAVYIAKHESKQGGAPVGKRYYNQFNEVGTLASGVLYSPNAGNTTPPGFGIFQLTNFGSPTRPPSKQELWSWKANVDSGLAWVKTLRQAADLWMNSPVPPPQYPNWGKGQRVQAAEETGAPVPVPDEGPYGQVTFKDGTARVIEDAVGMKMFNGAVAQYCVWDNPNVIWKFNRMNQLNPPFNYVERVCLEVP